MGVRKPPDLSKIKINIVDSYSFRRKLTLEEAVTLNQVDDKVKKQARVWWNHEASIGAGWYLKPEIANYAMRTELQEEPKTIASSLGLSSRVKKVNLLKNLIRSGIPPQMRPKVWKAISGMNKKKASAPDGYYRDLLLEVKDRETKATKQIDNDLHRTFPAHPKMDTEEGRQALRRILVAYSWRDSRVGYCQGMNFVGCLLYLVTGSEEDSFWLMSTILEDVLFPDFFRDDLAGTHVEQGVLRHLLEMRLPKLTAHLNDIHFDITFISTEWFLCLFARSFPTETTLRIWDVLFSEGARILFRVAIAVFQMKEAELLLTHNIGDAVCILQKTTNEMFDPEKLLEAAFGLGALPMSLISEHRQKQQTTVEAEIESRLRLKPERSASMPLEKREGPNAGLGHPASWAAFRDNKKEEVAAAVLADR